ncbi:MAG TPA: hydrogen peroxide-dependent heme synthase [Longimicrobiales bacterium]|nr:hydrogen peroxide-dependent heme synthase [Longimicrobiales bacterium]
MSELSPATLEGWYVLHQVFSLDWDRFGGMGPAERGPLAGAADDVLRSLATPASGGWTAAYRLVGGGADLMLIHFRPTLDELAAADLAIRRSPLGPLLRLEYDYTSVTEVGLYSATAQAAEEEAPGSTEYEALLDQLREAERGSAHIRTRLYPEVPDGMRYVSFYPMTKRRVHPDNWYALPVADRNRLMREHGMSGRRFAGRVFQVITGSMGFDDWEWGVTLFARDPLEFKRIVTDMRYDEASARYGEFGKFFVGIEMPDLREFLLEGRP